MTLAVGLTAIMTFLVGYLLGSIPFGLVVTKAAGLGDVRKIGSGNIGATNVLRTGNRGLAAATLAGDLLKGTVGALIGAYLGGTIGAIAGGVGAFVGHLLPIWLNFKGGKGVATFIGVILAWHWPSALAFCLIWLAVAIITRYSSLSALIACMAPPIVFALDEPLRPFALPTALMTSLLYYRHRENIARLVKGEETRIGGGG